MPASKVLVEIDRAMNAYRSGRINDVEFYRFCQEYQVDPNILWRKLPITKSDDFRFAAKAACVVCGVVGGMFLLQKLLDLLY